MAMTAQEVAACFGVRYQEPPRWIVRAPGRVNLIGEHTDYNDGFVLPLAIDRAVWIALRPRDDRRVVVHSVDLNQTAEFSLDRLTHDRAGWIEYVKGMAWSLQEAGYSLSGWEGVLTGDVPQGAGLSSSAALEMAVARAFFAVSRWAWDSATVARLGQRAENRWIGVQCGIMDLLVSAAGRAGHALWIDCRSLEMESVPMPSGTVVVVLDTATRRGLIDSAYNERRRQCEAATKFLGVPALRDVTLEQFEAVADRLDPVDRRRAKHVITENRRTWQAAQLMRRGDVVGLGRLMCESHASLRDDFEVSSDALNTMVEAAVAQPTCYGARMTGAGFGGCAVALVKAQSADAFVAQVSKTYHEKTSQTPAIYICQPSNGAELLDDDVPAR